MPHLNTLVRLLREAAPLGAQADALLALCRARPQVARALYLTWQPRSRSYEAVGGGERLPPGAGDPLQADDDALHARLGACRQLPLETLMAVPGWLGGRLRRAGWSHGLALVLPLRGEPGVLLLATDEAAGSAWLDWLGELLGEVLALAGGARRTAPLLAAEPLPALLLDAQARRLDGNPVFDRLAAELGLDDPRALLPANHVQLLRGCLEQARALQDAPSEVAGRQFLWSFIPDVGNGEVLVRGREASAQIQGEREAAKARRLYRQIIENTTDLISRRTLDGIILDASPASWTLLGYWPEELRGQPALPLLHPQDRERVARSTRDALEQDGYVTLTYRLRHRDGRYLWFETASRAIRETYTGAVVEVVSVSRDITARVRAEENLRRLAEVVEANTDLVLFVDPAGRPTYFNPSARRALNLDGEAIPASLDGLFDDALLRQLERDGWRCADERSVWQAEGYLRPRGERPPLPVSLVLLGHRAAGGERYYSLVARDMTERELRENQQRRHQDELAHTARLVTLGELASGIAHEINQPLAAVVNYAGASQRYLQSLGSNPDAAQRVAQGLARITEHANHASEVIRRLRAFLRKGQRRLQALDINELARESLGLCAWEAGQGKVAIEQALTDNLPPVYADRVLLEQVFLNLLRNAIEANRERHAGAPSAIVIGSALEADGRLCVWVEDDGPGASAETLERMFTPFYSSKPDGLGLGLSMSRGMVEGFGGTLQAHPAEGGGLRLECRLPAAGEGARRA
ncbi:PAS domain-containing sensor histidine kinase [Pseudomonas panipatensis]|uniref:histidine kinase n=1 Tax=Pseudomonas panipatensis TaxID=428992 RepID=A0A1G8I7Z8_9PSED|nr:PAS domain S-box protein [Pseudomonas panipatensis]SDI15109.1 PAS domain S-box-containing protein [Pseudomonas panipatensis]SMP75798.1 PAS domain S-box-containing protein [Pseudomonas panipatensis]